MMCFKKKKKKKKKKDRNKRIKSLILKGRSTQVLIRSIFFFCIVLQLKQYIHNFFFSLGL